MSLDSKDKNKAFHLYQEIFVKNQKGTKYASEHGLLKFERSVIVNLMQISLLFGVYTICFLIFVETSGVS